MKKAVLNAVKLNSLKPSLPRIGSPELKSYSPDDVFFCPEESQFYSQCLEKMVLSRCEAFEQVIEFGTGDGTPVISGLLKTRFAGTIHGYELSHSACEVAQNRIEQYQLTDKYKIHNHCFFEGYKATGADYLIANPPYIPAPDNSIYMPALHGGVDGATITNKLLSVGCQTVLLMISAYSNPVETIQHAIDEGYSVVDFMVTPLQFGYYSSEPKVRDWITKLREENKAFYSSNIYFLAGVLFQHKSAGETDLSTELIKVITAL
ncbi:MAG: methyltransferase [Leptolyngbyaceae cyanobacterium CSU_1_4]|nr:methyltransferase [Leptolyngbyaceae cyanobacterium CSU_1_4]